MKLFSILFAIAISGHGSKKLRIFIHRNKTNLAEEPIGKIKYTDWQIEWLRNNGVAVTDFLPDMTVTNAGWTINRLNYYISRLFRTQRWKE